MIIIVITIKIRMIIIKGKMIKIIMMITIII